MLKSQISLFQRFRRGEQFQRFSWKFSFFYFLVCGFSFWFLVFSFYFSASASRVDELKFKIEQRNQEMREIEQEIEEYSRKIEQTAKEAKTLKNQIKKAEMTISKLGADIRLTQNRIYATALRIEELSFNIRDLEGNISKHKEAMSESIRLLNEKEAASIIEILLSYDTLSDFFSSLYDIENFEKSLSLNLANLQELNNSLKKEKNLVLAEKENYELLKSQLSDKQDIKKGIRRSRANLLKETKNKETAYKQLLNDRLKKKEALEAEIRVIEEELKVVIDPASLPSSVSGILSWPLDKIKITQYFGNTPFATRNPQVYKGMGHNGIDLRASIGTPARAAEKGTVTAVGDTDKECRGVSYGKWVLIEHPNNLSTLYAHLSLIKTKKGDSVQKGQIIGYTGNSGYTTGPHLHFATFASRAVRVSQIKSKICGTMMTLPLAPYNGYLNPLSYL
jgi:murein DD-endopeptidase MepM/ murein hydrolase activator NlpD